jgi:membrane protein DedA with SNARE-associated domain
MIPAWYFASTWDINIFLAITLWTAGSIWWSLINYYIAKRWWEKLWKKLIWEKYFNMWVDYFEENWEITTFIWRLIPLIRQYISFPAWLFKMNISKFILFTSMWAGIWVIFLTVLWYYIWENQSLISEYTHYFIAWTMVILTIAIIAKRKYIKKLIKK